MTWFDWYLYWHPCFPSNDSISFILTFYIPCLYNMLVKHNRRKDHSIQNCFAASIVHICFIHLKLAKLNHTTFTTFFARFWKRVVNQAGSPDVWTHRPSEIVFLRQEPQGWWLNVSFYQTIHIFFFIYTNRLLNQSKIRYTLFDNKYGTCCLSFTSSLNLYFLTGYIVSLVRIA